MVPERVLETWWPAQQRASGFLISGRIALTAGHCVPDLLGAEVQVRRLSGDWLNATVRWHGAGAGIDAALLELADADSSDPYGLGEQLVPLGRPVSRVTARAHGFPEADELPDGVTELEHAVGVLDPDNYAKIDPTTGRRGLYCWDTSLRLSAGAGVASGWCGMSGAAVLVEGRLVGVTVAVAPKADLRLLVTPIAEVLADPAASAVLGVRILNPEPVWEHMELLEPAQQLSTSPADGHGSKSRIALLQARRRTVPWVARSADLDQLRAWCLDSALPSDVRLVTGVGGTGKTRLGVELCIELARHGWVTGFALMSVPTYRPLFELTENRLVVVDDAMNHLDQLEAIVREAEDAARRAADGAPKLRVLAFARTAERWWDRLAARHPDLVLATPYPLIPPPVEDRRKVYRQAVARFQDEVSAKGAQLPDMPLLSDPMYETYGVILERALLDADPAIREIEGGVNDVRLQLLEAEADEFWMKAAERFHLQLDADLVARIVELCSLVLVDGATDGDREAAAAEALRALPDLADASAAERHRIARWAHGLSESPGGYLPQIRPQLVAAAAAQRLLQRYPSVISTLLGCAALEVEHAGRTELERAAAQVVRVLSALVPEPGSTELLDSAVGHALSTVLQVHLCQLVKLAIYNARARSGHSAALAAVIAQAVHIVDLDPRYSAEAADELPATGGFVLEELALALRTQAVKHWRLRSDDAVERLTRALHQLSITQHDTGGLGQAKQSALEEISRLRAVISESVSPAPAAEARRQFNLSRAYANLANILCDMNERYEAVSQGRQAHRTLAHVVETGQLDQTAINALQIEVLSNLSKALRRVGQGNSAREAAAQAERIAKAMFARQPTEFHTWYAISLRRLSAAMSDAGEYKAATSKAAKAVQHFSVMAEHDPGEWREDAAKAHRNYAERLVEVGQFERAVEQASRAIALWTELSAHRAQAYDEELGKAQIALARAQHALADPAAEQSIADALDRLSRFATGGTDALGADDTWADAMTQQAIVQLDRAEPAAAESAQAAVTALRRLREGRTFGPVADLHLARSLFVLARCQLEQDADAARALAEEARTLLRSAQEAGCSLPRLVTDAEQAWQSRAGQPPVAVAY